MKIFLLSFLLIISADIAMAKTATKKSKGKKVECALNFKEIHSLLDQTPKRYKSIEPEKIDEKERIVSQVAWIKTGERLKFSSGGCAQFSYSFSYTELKKKSFKDALEQKNYAIKLLQKTPSIDASNLVKALKKTEKLEQTSAGIYPLECESAQCTLDLSMKDRIKITYSMQL